VALEIEVDEFGQRQLRQRLRLAAEPRFNDVPIVSQRGALGREGRLASSFALGVVIAQAPTYQS
jgi:hypothetical protein